MKRLLFVVGICLAVGTAMAQDPAKTDPDKSKVVLENESLSVLEYKDQPGAKTIRHHHPDSVVYALAPFTRKLTLGNGTVVTVKKKEGEVYWVPAQDHIGENIGTTD